MILTYLTFLCTACSDPGFLARRIDNPNYSENSKSIFSELIFKNIL